jgi:hypothetical protein
MQQPGKTLRCPTLQPLRDGARVHPAAHRERGEKKKRRGSAASQLPAPNKLKKFLIEQESGVLRK